MNLGTVVFLHERIANAAVLYMAILGIWSFINYARGRGVEGSVIGAVVVGELLMLMQASLGIILLLSGLYPVRAIHFLYGSLAVIALPALWVYTRGATDRRASLIWALVGLFMVGLTLRAIGTAT